jgi:hypothetical protein
MARIVRAATDAPLSLPWWSWLPRWRYRVIGSVDAADLVPDRLPRKGLVVVENHKGRAWVAFDCPCERRHRVLLPLDKHHRPHWRLDVGRFASLYPSVDSHEKGIRCHFWLTHGRIRWAPEPTFRETEHD